MVKKLKKRANIAIKIPDYVRVIYCEKNNLLLIQNKMLLIVKKLIIPKNIIFLSKDKKTVILTNCFRPDSGFHNKKSLENSYITYLKKCFYLIFTQNCIKLHLVGISYKVSLISVGCSNFLYLKLGFSHPVYYKITDLFEVHLKKKKIFFLSHDIFSLTYYTSAIRAYRPPNIYTGKGVLYENETIILKEGKKS